MNITYTVEPTEIRFTSPPYSIPTITVALGPLDGAATSDLVAYHKTHNARLMSAAHHVASRVWSVNDNGYEINVEPQGNGAVRITVDVGRDDEARAEIDAQLKYIAAAASAYAAAKAA